MVFWLKSHFFKSMNIKKFPYQHGALLKDTSAVNVQGGESVVPSLTPPAVPSPPFMATNPATFQQRGLSSDLQARL